MDTRAPQPKKILYLVNDLSQTFGWSTHAYLLGVEAARQGHEVHVAVERTIPEVPEGVLQHPVLYAPVTVLWNPIRIVLQSIRLRRLIRSLAPDLVHVISEPYVHACVLGVPRHVPVMLTIHGTYAYIPAGLRGVLRRYLGMVWFQLALKKVSAIVSVSEQTKRFFLKHTKGFSPDRVRVIYNAVDVTHTDSYRVPERGNATHAYVDVITVGAVKKRKGIHLSIPALAAWAKERTMNIRYHVVGTIDHTTPYVHEVVALADKHTSEYFKVIFHGPVTEEQKRALLKNAALYIHLEEVFPDTTDVEGFGIGIVEAASYGVPALVLAGSATVEAVSPTRSGIVLTALEHDEVSRALDALLVSKTCTVDMVKEWARSFLPAPQFRSIENLYEQVVRFHNVPVVVSAAYGMGNIGDEAICTTIVHDIRVHMPSAYITVLVFDARQFAKAHPEYVEDSRIRVRQFYLTHIRQYALPYRLMGFILGYWAITRAALFVWGGGGLVRNRAEYLRYYIRPLWYACQHNRRVLVYPIGVDVITDPEVKSILTSLPSHVKWHVRDTESKRNLDRVYSDPARVVEVIPDPVFHFPSLVTERVHAAHGSVRIGLNLAFYKAQHADSEELRAWIQKIGETLEDLEKVLRKPIEIVWLPTDAQKDALCISLLETFLQPSQIVIHRPNPHTPEEFIMQARSLDLLITSRMHALILSSFVSDLPVISFLYDEKVEHLARAVPAPSCYYALADGLPRDILAGTLHSGEPRCVRDWEYLRRDSLRIREVLTSVMQGN